MGEQYHEHSPEENIEQRVEFIPESQFDGFDKLCLQKSPEIHHDESV